MLIVAEMRAFFGIENPKFYFFSLFGSVLCMSISCIPAMIGYFTDSFEVYPFINEDLVIFGMLVYAVVRAVELLIHNLKCKDAVSDAEEVVVESAEAEEVAEVEAEAEAPAEAEVDEVETEDAAEAETEAE